MVGYLTSFIWYDTQLGETKLLPSYIHGTLSRCIPTWIASWWCLQWLKWVRRYLAAYLTTWFFRMMYTYNYCLKGASAYNTPVRQMRRRWYEYV